MMPPAPGDWDIDMKALKIAGAAVGVVIVGLVSLLVFGLPLGFLTDALQDRIERDTGYRLRIAGSASLGLWPTLNATLTDVTLQDPKERDGNARLDIGKLRAEVVLSSLWSGRPEISDLTIERPIVHLPLLRERFRDIPSRSRSNAVKSGSASPVRIDRVTVTDGAIILSNPRDRVENRLDGIAARAVTAADGKIRITGNAAGAHPLKFDVKADAPSMSAEPQTVPVAFNIDMPGTLRAPLSGNAELRLNGQVIMINNLGGALDDGAFNGWASVDMSSKPLVKLDLDFQRLTVAGPEAQSSGRSLGWSTAPIDLRGLNYVDAQVKLSAAEVKASGVRVGPTSIEASLAGGVLKATVGNLSLYDGQASGEVVVDASSGNPAYAMHCDLVGVRALPLLQNLAEFDKLDAKMQAKFALRSSGASQQAIMSNLGGSAFVVLQDGTIRGINVAQMIRSLTSNPLSGWQESKELSTDLTQLSASFRIERGQAVTSDLNLIGPLVKVTGAGTIDLGNRALAMRVEPKLVLTTEGQGRISDPIGLGIPVVIDGSWAQPRFYPDMAGMLDNPEAAYARLKQMGQGLFGKDGAGLNNLISGIGGLIGNSATGQSAAPNGATSAAPAAPDTPGAPSDVLGGQLGAAIGNLIQQGLQQGLPSRGRTLAPQADVPAQTPQQASQAVPQAAPPVAPELPQDSAQDSQPMNEVLRRLFNR
jgi:AsmA protein